MTIKFASKRRTLKDESNPKMDFRKDFRSLFISHGISDKEINEMSDTEFQATLLGFLDSQSNQDKNQISRQMKNSTTAYDKDFGNGNFNEDEAVRIAIEKSLDDQLIPPHLRPKPSPQNEVGISATKKSLLRDTNNNNSSKKRYPSAPKRSNRILEAIPDPQFLLHNASKPTQKNQQQKQCRKKGNERSRMRSASVRSVKQNHIQNREPLKSTTKNTNNKTSDIANKTENNKIKEFGSAKSITKNTNDLNFKKDFEKELKSNNAIYSKRNINNNKISRVEKKTVNKVTETKATTSGRRTTNSSNVRTNLMEYKILHTDKTERENKLTETKTPTSGRRTNISNINNNKKISNIEKKTNEHNVPTSGRRTANNNVNNKNKISDTEKKTLNKSNEYNPTKSTTRNINNSNINNNKISGVEKKTVNKVTETKTPTSGRRTTNSSNVRTNLKEFEIPHMDKIEKINKLTETKTPTSGRRTNVSNTNNNKISNFEKKANEHNAPTSGRKIAINNVNNKNKISDIEAKANEHNTLISERRTNDSNIRSNINIVKKTETENKLKESENPISANINKFDRKTDSTNAAKAIPSHNEHNSTERQAKTSAIEKELSSTQEIVQLQNIEYNEALKEAQIRTELEKQTAEEKANEEEEMQKLINSLPPEPAIGVTIAVLLKNGKRVMRRFDPKSKGIYVYVWVLMQINENTPDEKLSLDSFDVKLSVSAKKIEKEQTLEEQNISGRVFAIVDIF